MYLVTESITVNFNSIGNNKSLITKNDSEERRSQSLLNVELIFTKNIVIIILYYIKSYLYH